MYVRGIRGATTAEENNSSSILEASRELLLMMQKKNDIDVKDIVSILFTTTDDIDAVFPAQAARTLGWDKVPLLDFKEMEVPEAMAMCIRVLIHVNTEKDQDQIQHVYLKEARKLRPDID